MLTMPNNEVNSELNYRGNALFASTYLGIVQAIG